MESSLITRWRDAPVILDNYDDVAVAVAVARKARGKIVEFDWPFTADELRSLRRGVFEWGRRVTGRYKAFDARVLKAINTALNEADSARALNEPTRAALDADVACLPEGEAFRLRGHAPFDIIVGYGMAGVTLAPTAHQLLGPAVQEKLAGAVAPLGWDLHRLHEMRLRPALNALYGNPLDFAMSDDLPADRGPAVDVAVHFHGPFTAQEEDGFACVFTCDVSARSGVYLWTLSIDGRAVPWYIGQTRVGFRTRLAQHVRAILAGEYTPYDLEALVRADYRRAAGAVAGRWLETLPTFLANYEQLVPHLIGQIRMTKFHLAPLPDDPHLLNRVEGGLGRHFKEHPEIGAFFTPGLKLPAPVPNDRPMRLQVSSDVAISGLPAEVLL